MLFENRSPSNMDAIYKQGAHYPFKIMRVISAMISSRSIMDIMVGKTRLEDFVAMANKYPTMDTYWEDKVEIPRAHQNTNSPLDYSYPCLRCAPGLPAIDPDYDHQSSDSLGR
jgi:hypothetical protein